MSWQKLWIRMVMCVALFAAPFTASAMSYHAASTHVTAATGVTLDINIGVDSPVQGIACAKVAQSAASSVPSDNNQTDRDCDDCCFASCAKHLTALPASSITFAPVRRKSQAVTVVDVANNGRDINPDRKPPRI